MLEKEKSPEFYAELCTVEFYGYIPEVLKELYEKDKGYVFDLRWTFNNNSWNIKISGPNYFHKQIDSEAFDDGTYGYIGKSSGIVSHANCAIPLESIKIAIENFLKK
ncbi:MAG: hypothetical protein WC070_01340 [Candidatus Magasanikbacteria bacterium]